MTRTPDPLDDLLDRSAPPVPVTDTPALRAAYRAMARDARRRARPARRGGRLALGAGLAVLLAGGASAAAASGLFSWSGWAADPDIVYAFTLPGGRQCEERILVDDRPSAGDGVATPSAEGAALREWARSADFAALVDVQGEVAALDPADGLPLAATDGPGTVLPDPDGPDAVMIVLRADGGLDVVPRTAAGPTADDLYANAVDRGLQRALDAKAAELGAQAWATSLRMQCEPAR